MPKASPAEQYPSSPGSNAAARGNHNPQDARAPNPARSPSSRNGSMENPTPGSPATPASTKPTAKQQTHPIPTFVRTVAFDSWTRELDDELREFCKGGREGERKAILSINARFPNLSPQVIWSRILYLGLTSSKRRPYLRGEWEPDEIALLEAGYCDGRRGATHAINVLLQMHPDWTRSKVSWKAKSLGFSHVRPNAYQRWSDEADRRLTSCEGFLMESAEQRMKRSRGSILSRLAALDRRMEFFGGFKTKDLTDDLHMDEAQVRRLERRGVLVRDRGRITEKSFKELCRSHPNEIPFQTLSPYWKNRLIRDYGYRRPKLPRRGGRRKRKVAEPTPANVAASVGGIT